MINDKEVLESGDFETAKAEEILLKFGLPCIPENIQAVIEQHRTLQQPEEFLGMFETDSPIELSRQMKEREIKRIVHAEDPSLWIYTKLAMTLADFMNISDDKKADLKLIMLYHDLGKVGIKESREIRYVQRKELSRGKLYKVAKWHEGKRSQDIEAGFRANGLSGRKLEVFMTVVQNHMNTSLSEMSGPKLVELFKGFGKSDEERKQVAELLALTIQVDGNACLQTELCPDGELQSPKEANTTGEDFGKIWAKYLEAKKEMGAT